MKSSMRRCSLGSTHWSGLNVPSAPSPRGTWQAILVGKIVGLEFGDLARAGLAPASSAAQVSSTPQASGVTSPSPVTTTLRMAETARQRAQACALSMYFTASPTVTMDLRRVIGNLDAEFFFERHDQLDGVEAVGAQIFDEGRVVGDLVGIHVQMLDDDLLHALGSIAHGLVSLSYDFIAALGRTRRTAMFPRKSAGCVSGRFGNTIRFGPATTRLKPLILSIKSSPSRH